MAETYSYADFEIFCAAELARGERDMAAMMKKFVEANPSFQQPLMQDFIADQSKFLALRARLNERLIASRQPASYEPERNHHLDTPAPSWADRYQDDWENPRERDFH